MFEDDIKTNKPDVRGGKPLLGEQSSAEEVGLHCGDRTMLKKIFWRYILSECNQWMNPADSHMVTTLLGNKRRSLT